MMSKGVKRDSLNTNIVTSNPVFTVLCGGGVMLNARPDRILDLPVGGVTSCCLLDESFSTVLPKKNIIRSSDALAEEGFCIGQTCRPEFISGPNQYGVRLQVDKMLKQVQHDRNTQWRGVA